MCVATHQTFTLCYCIKVSTVLCDRMSPVAKADTAPHNYFFKHRSASDPPHELRYGKEKGEVEIEPDEDDCPLFREEMGDKIEGNCGMSMDRKECPRQTVRTETYKWETPDDLWKLNPNGPKGISKTGEVEK